MKLDHGVPISQSWAKCPIMLQLVARWTSTRLDSQANVRCDRLQRRVMDLCGLKSNARQAKRATCQRHRVEFLPRRGYASKPRVASTLGKTARISQPQRGCAHVTQDYAHKRVSKSLVTSKALAWSHSLGATPSGLLSSFRVLSQG
jgi:hypothetical protein